MTDRRVTKMVSPRHDTTMTRYAVNLCDLSELPRSGHFNPTALLLQDFVSSAPTHVMTDPKVVDSAAVILDGPAGADTARVTALVSLLQTVIGPRKIKRRIRCYREGTRGGWTEI